MKILLVIISLGLLFTACSTEITNYEECVAAGNPTTQSIPSVCTADGEEFIPEHSNEEWCTISGGEWVTAPSECEGMEKTVCERLGGTFNECASACRNNPEAEICTMQCVQVCDFE